MRGPKRQTVLVFMLVALLASLGCTCLSLLPYPPGDPMCLEAPYAPPPATFQESHLVGIWETRYGRESVDRLVLRHDGTFKQIYRDPGQRDYRYETPWNQWWLDPLRDGGLRLHLKGARFYREGITIAELEGVEFLGESSPSPMPFYDPIADEHLFMVGELVLNVRVDSSRELLLHHLSTTHQVRFVTSGCESGHFRRVDTP